MAENDPLWAQYLASGHPRVGSQGDRSPDMDKFEPTNAEEAAWVAAFAREHGGRPPAYEDYYDKQWSMDFAGQHQRGPSLDDWRIHYYVKYRDNDPYTAASRVSFETGKKVTPAQPVWTYQDTYGPWGRPEQRGGGPTGGGPAPLSPSPISPTTPSTLPQMRSPLIGDPYLDPGMGTGVPGRILPPSPPASNRYRIPPGLDAYTMEMDALVQGLLGTSRVGPGATGMGPGSPAEALEAARLTGGRPIPTPPPDIPFTQDLEQYISSAPIRTPGPYLAGGMLVGDTEPMGRGRTFADWLELPEGPMAPPTPPPPIPRGMVPGPYANEMPPPMRTAGPFNLYRAAGEYLAEPYIPTPRIPGQDWLEEQVRGAPGALLENAQYWPRRTWEEVMIPILMEREEALRRRREQGR